MTFFRNYRLRKTGLDQCLKRPVSEDHHVKKHHGKRLQTLLKSERQYLYHIYCSFISRLTYKKSLLVICKILRLFVNTLTANGKSSLLNIDNLRQPIQMLSQKQKIFSQFSSASLRCSLSFEILNKKYDPRSWCIFKITDSEKLR